MITQKRVLGLDIGRKRIGLAISDELHISSSPLQSIDLGSNRAKSISSIISVCKDMKVGTIVAGYPLSLGGEKTPQTLFTEKYLSALEIELQKHQNNIENINIELWDERMTSIEAERYLGAQKGSAQKRGVERRQAKDQISALILLESYLLSRPKKS